uniref:ARID domain-containing protein n=1 Tax=Eptatretus burgeri TaxID=7764 RepID=A0A8C4QSI0_EPTBU
MKAIDEPPCLAVGTDVSAKYRGAFCEAKIKTVKRLLKLKVTYKHDSSTQMVQDDQVLGLPRVGAIVEVKTEDGMCLEAVVNRLTDGSWYTVVFDDGDERTLRRSSLCLKGERHFAESETLDQLPLTNPEHFGTPVIGKKSNRGRRSNPVPSEEVDEEEEEEVEAEVEEQAQDDLIGKVVLLDLENENKLATNIGLVVSSSCSEEVAVKKDHCFVRLFTDGRFLTVPKTNLQEVGPDCALKVDPSLKPILDVALEFKDERIVPTSWRAELSEDSTTTDDDDDEQEDDDDDVEQKGDRKSAKEEPEEEAFPVEKENFLQHLYKFMEDKGTPINKTPFLGYRVLNLYKLYRLVQEKGGYDGVRVFLLYSTCFMLFVFFSHIFDRQR